MNEIVVDKICVQLDSLRLVRSQSCRVALADSILRLVCLEEDWGIELLAYKLRSDAKTFDLHQDIICEILHACSVRVWSHKALLFIDRFGQITANHRRYELDTLAELVRISLKCDYIDVRAEPLVCIRAKLIINEALGHGDKFVPLVNFDFLKITIQEVEACGRI